MERNEIKDLIALNRTNFPNFYKTMNQDDMSLLVNTWYVMFGKLETEIVRAAFMQALAKAEFPVVPANVFAILNAQQKAYLPTTDELFDMAEKAANGLIRFYNYDQCQWIHWENSVGHCKPGFPQEVKAIYNSLPAILREWKHSPLELIRWVDTITDENESYLRHEFKEIMGDRLNRRETLGIGFNDEFTPKWDALAGCMKAIGPNGQIIGNDKPGLLGGAV